VKKLHLDVETFSSINLKKAGAYKYVEAPDFEILMLAYAFDEEPTHIVDLASGELLPDRVLEAFKDSKIQKCAHNANFERLTIGKSFLPIEAEQWNCSAVKSAYCGLPLGLDMVSKALKLEDKAKDAAGKALINYFCKPCKPTKTNGKRTRNLPHHDPEKWASFLAYCVQDVEAEREVMRKLAEYELPQQEKYYYVIDQKINDRGIFMDLDMVRSAVKIESTFKKLIISQMREVSGIENPNSPAQLKGWLSQAMQKEITSLAKDEIPKLLQETESEAVRDILMLRKKSSKTSTRKYTAMLNCFCKDGRAHGLFQFYGANRTGRWAGRLIQLQNLRRNNLKDLELAREVVKEGDFEIMELLFDNVADILSQLIRTSFIPSQGNIFAVADFSAIEARVIAWLAGEQWRLDVFHSHGKIYEASAAMMFGAPIESIGKGSDLRAKGKVAELALGFQGSVGALKRMGGEDMGLDEPEMLAIVKKWRKANPAIVKMWYDIEKLAKAAIKHKRRIVSKYKGLAFEFDGTMLTIELCSGRKLFYYRPRFGKNHFGSESIKYQGVNQETKQWTYLDTYGGKLVENIVQATARDLLAVAMRALAEKGKDMVMHVHDEVICEVKVKNGAAELEEMCRLMSKGVSWAEGLPLDVDGYLTKFYKKD